MSMTVFIDLGAGLLSLAAILCYHFWLGHRAKHAPRCTVHSTNILVRQRWVVRVMQDPAREMLAVQTLRNSVMAASFMASTAILLMMGVLSLADNAERIQHIQQVLPLTMSAPALDQFKLLWVGGTLFGAFFLFAMSIRFFTHVGYLIAAPSDEHASDAEMTAAAGYLNRAGRFFSLGLRAFFFCFPLAFWLFGPATLLVATVALIVALALLDRTPDADAF